MPAKKHADLFVVELAALLHDVADWKFAGGDHEAGPRAAPAVAGVTGSVAPAIIDHVCEIIAGLSFKGAGVATPMHSLEGQIVQDADRLDALGAIGIARTFAYGGHKGQAMHDPAVPPQIARLIRGLQEEHRHHDQPLLRKTALLKDRMNTAAGKRLAAERHDFMERFLEQFFAEWEGQR